MAWDWLGGAADFVTGGLTDFDQKGAGGYNWIPGTFGKQFNPIGGGSDGKWGPEASNSFSFGDAMDAFTKGYSATMGGGGPTPGGSSFLNAYTSGKGATPTSTSPVSTSSAFTAGGGTHTLGDSFIIKEQPDFYAFKDNVQYPVQQGGGSGGGSKGGGLLDTVGKAVGIAGGLKAAFPVTFAALCDIRTKTDISPLETTEVNDDLAQVAFFVKELRECS